MPGSPWTEASRWDVLPVHEHNTQIRWDSFTTFLFWSRRGVREVPQWSRVRTRRRFLTGCRPPTPRWCWRRCLPSSQTHLTWAQSTSEARRNCNCCGYTDEWGLPRKAVTSSGAELPAAINVAPATSWDNPSPVSVNGHKHTKSKHQRPLKDSVFTAIIIMFCGVTDPPDQILLPAALEKLHTTLKTGPELVWTWYRDPDQIQIVLMIASTHPHPL